MSVLIAAQLHVLEHMYMYHACVTVHIIVMYICGYRVALLSLATFMCIYVYVWIQHPVWLIDSDLQYEILKFNYLTSFSQHVLVPVTINSTVM